MTPLAWIDGASVALTDAALPLLDEGLLRGDGAFETVGVWGGRPFRLESHLERLRASMAALALPEPDLDVVRAAAAHVLGAAEGADAVLRVYVFAGGRVVATVALPPERPDIRTLVTQPAPWIAPVDGYPAAGAKSLSYAPNMAAHRRARQAGADDALLLAADGTVLEGSTFAVLWVHGGVLRTPAVDLGIVDSISREALLELARDEGVMVEEGRWGMDELARADEVLVCSSVRPCLAVQAVDGLRFGPEAPVCGRLGPLLDRLRRDGD